MIELLIIRHGETAWNAADIFRGRVSIGLSENGLKQVEKLADYVSDREIDEVYCSPLQRAMQTAIAIARRHNLTIQPDERLTDLDFGEWEGMPRSDVKARYGELYERWLERSDLKQIPGGETLEDDHKRSISAVNASF
jgi:broad specificity phosphatase PhoE